MVRKPASIRKLRTSSAKSTRIDGDGNAIHNSILLSVLSKECPSVFSRLVLVNLRLHDLLQEVGQPIQYCYFPNTAMASVLNVMDDGKSVEVGLAGHEGFVGLPIVAGFRNSATRVVTQGEGTAFRISSDDMRESLRSCPQLMISLLRYSQESTMEVTQIAACNRLHPVEERLARWLLMSQDRIRSKILPLTQEFLAQMLGTRRASVSIAASILQRAGLIHYRRGAVSILNRAGLEEACCECYNVIQRQLETWRKDTQ
jgi:CRP-like cAMP-binding protein